jgi:hypothetical protein
LIRGTNAGEREFEIMGAREGLPTHRNLAIRKTFDEVWTIIKSRHKVPKTKWVTSLTVEQIVHDLR